MLEFWDGIHNISSFSEFWEWVKIQSLGMQIFAWAMVFGVVYAAIVLVLYLIPFESD